MDFGLGLNNSANLDFITAPSPEELRDQIRTLRTSHKLFTIYAAGNVHIAWLIPLIPGEVDRVKKRGRPPLKKDGVT